MTTPDPLDDLVAEAMEGVNWWADEIRPEVDAAIRAAVLADRARQADDAYPCPRCRGHERAFDAAEANLRNESRLHERALARVAALEAQLDGMHMGMTMAQEDAWGRAHADRERQAERLAAIINGARISHGYPCEFARSRNELLGCVLCDTIDGNTDADGYWVKRAVLADRPTP